MNLPEVRQDGYGNDGKVPKHLVPLLLRNLLSTEQWTTMGYFKVRHSIRPSTPIENYVVPWNLKGEICIYTYRGMDRPDNM